MQRRRSTAAAIAHSIGLGVPGIVATRTPARATAAVLPLVVESPIRTVSEANSHEHWRVRQRRAKDQRSTIALVLRGIAAPPAPPLVVTLTRISPRDLDDDNLAGAFKHVRDGIADWLGIDDRSPLVTWRYAQRRGTRGYWGIETRVERREASA